MRIGFGGTCKRFTQLITGNKKALPVRSACGVKLNVFRIGLLKASPVSALSALPLLDDFHLLHEK